SLHRRGCHTDGWKTIRSVMKVGDAPFKDQAARRAPRHDASDPPLFAVIAVIEGRCPAAEACVIGQPVGLLEVVEQRRGWQGISAPIATADDDGGRLTA